MGKLIVSTQMTLDGVTDQIDGWFDAEGEHEEHAFDQLLAADALLLGRKTYEGLAGVWPGIGGAESIFADRINSMPKYVASRTLKAPLIWNASLIDGDLVERVPQIKRSHRGNLMSYGCGELAHYLAIHGLLDEIHFWVHPIIWGNGVRPFATHGPIPLRMKSATTFRSGVTLVCCEPAPRSTD
jgi:dihydrofolate reductase